MADQSKTTSSDEGGPRNSLPLSADDEERVARAVAYLRQGDVSTGAAELAGVPKTVLLMKLGDYGIDTFDMSEEEFLQELDHARHFERTRSL